MRRGRGDGYLEQAAASRQLAAEEVRVNTFRRLPDESPCVPSRLLVKPGKAPNVIPDESACGGRDPVSSNPLFFLDSGYPPSADSGMTDLVLAIKILSFSTAS